MVPTLNTENAKALKSIIAFHENSEKCPTSFHYSAQPSTTALWILVQTAKSQGSLEDIKDQLGLND